MAAQPLIGRDRELGVIDERLAAVRAARGSALILRGDPGVGKTALADVAAERARGCSVLRATGVESQAPLPFAVLRTLTAPVVPLLDLLPDAQQRALASALGLEPPSPHDRFAVPAALLGLLREAAVRAPVVVVVDDLQWVDAGSREALLFVARRVAGLRIALLATTRTPRGDAETARLDQHVLPPLDEPAARVLMARDAADLPPALAGDLLRTAGGNPLALLELPRLLTVEQRGGRAPLDGPPRSGPALERAFAQEIAGLPDDSRRALGVAAAMDHDPVAWLLRALAALGIAESALGPAERSGILRLDGDVIRFRHALVRAAAYHASPDADRARTHAVLAATTDDHRLRAWHLAAAAGGADRDADAAAALDEAG
ncbi:AAA family ATPase, partial [Patulibacter minatonensis]|uniref:AAA family ATPase n=1 Tax=Patulibacter minatonensis TaxID=298163 RepID=UPI00146FBC4D